MYFARGLKRILAAAGAVVMLAMLPDMAAAQPTFFQQVKGDQCEASPCTLTFAVPAGERRELNTVSCRAILDADADQIRSAVVVASNPAGGTTGIHFLVPIKHADKTHSINHQLFLAALAGGRFLIELSFSGTGLDLDCGISGRRVD